MQRYVATAQENGLDNMMRYAPKYASRQVFDKTEEEELSNYLLTASKHHHDLTTFDCRRLAYEYAIRNGIQYPHSWDVNRIAGRNLHSH